MCSLHLDACRAGPPAARRTAAGTGNPLVRSGPSTSRTARAGAGHGAPCPAAAAAVLLRQPAGCRVPGRLDEGPRAPLPAARPHGGGHQGQPAVHRRSGRSSRRSAGERRGAVAGVDSGGLGGGPPRACGRAPREGTPQVPSVPGVARDYPGVAAGAGPRALGPDEGGVRRPGCLPAWIQQRAHDLGISAEHLREGVAGVLNYLRRRRALHDPEH